MKHLRIPWEMGNAGDEGAGPDPCPMPSGSHHAFPCRKDAGTQKAPGDDMYP